MLRSSWSELKDHISSGRNAYCVLSPPAGRIRSRRTLGGGLEQIVQQFQRSESASREATIRARPFAGALRCWWCARRRGPKYAATTAAKSVPKQLCRPRPFARVATGASPPPSRSVGIGPLITCDVRRKSGRGGERRTIFYGGHGSSSEPWGEARKSVHQRRWQIGFDGREHQTSKRSRSITSSGSGQSRTRLSAPDGAQHAPAVAARMVRGKWRIPWAINPGYDRLDYRGRRAPSTTSACSATTPTLALPRRSARAGRRTRYSTPLPEGMDCQRCHGPGARHVTLAGGSSATRDGFAPPSSIPCSSVRTGR